MIRTDHHEVVQFGGPVLELMTDSRSRIDRRIAQLGPDIMADGVRRAALPAAAARGRPHARDRRRPARPAQPLRHRQPLEVRGLLPGRARPLAAGGRGERRRGARRGARGAPADAALGQGGGHVRDRMVFERHGGPCRRCGTTIRARGQGDDNRTTYWCPDVPGADPGRAQGRRPRGARQHRSRASRRRSSTAWT